MRLARAWIRCALVVLTVASSGAAAQDDAPSAGGWLASRPSLEREVATLDDAARSPAYSERSRARAATRAAALRRRLDTGDFRPGDRLHLSITGAVAFDDTLTVRSDRSVDVPGIATVPLDGVLRVELPDRIERAVRQSVLDARVRVETFVRIGAFGQVARPGYVLLPPDATVDQLFTAVGGFAATATPMRFGLYRADTLLLDARAVRAAIAARRTLAELEIGEGDYFRAEAQRPPFDRATTLQIVGLVLTPLLTLVAVR